MAKSTYELINEFRKEMNERFDSIEKKMCTDYVTKDRYTPVERLVYGMVGVILLAVIGGLISLVINKTGVSAKW